MASLQNQKWIAGLNYHIYHAVENPPQTCFPPSCFQFFFVDEWRESSFSVIQQQMQIEIVKASRANIDEYQIRSGYTNLKMQLELIPTGRHLATPEEQERLLTEIRYLDLIYFIHKNKHIEGFSDIMREYPNEFSESIVTQIHPNVIQPPIPPSVSSSLSSQQQYSLILPPQLPPLPTLPTQSSSSSSSSVLHEKVDPSGVEPEAAHSQGVEPEAVQLGQSPSSRSSALAEDVLPLSLPQQSESMEERVKRLEQRKKDQQQQIHK